MANFKLYIALHFIGICIPAVLMYLPATQDLGGVLLFIYVLVYKPLLDKFRLEQKGFESKGQSIWKKYPFWSERCREVLYTR